MADAFPEWLARLTSGDADRPGGEWQGRPAADSTQLAKAEERLGMQLPDDYRELFRASNGGTLTGPNESIHLERVEDLPELNLDEEYHTALPGMLVVGDNGGGAVYIYDPGDRIRHGRWALYWVSLGDLSLSSVRLAGGSLAEVFRRIADGVMFFEEPPSDAETAS